MKTISLIALLIISTVSFSQKVGYKDLIGTSWKSFDEAQAWTMTFTFIDSTHLRQKSYAPRYQPTMETVIKYSLDTEHETTLLNIEWKGALLKCTSCKVNISRDLLIIQSVTESTEDKGQNKNKTSNGAWVFKKLIPAGYRLKRERIPPTSLTLQH